MTCSGFGRGSRKIELTTRSALVVRPQPRSPQCAPQCALLTNPPGLCQSTSHGLGDPLDCRFDACRRFGALSCRVCFRPHHRSGGYPVGEEAQLRF